MAEISASLAEYSAWSLVLPAPAAQQIPDLTCLSLAHDIPVQIPSHNPYPDSGMQERLMAAAAIMYEGNCKSSDNKDMLIFTEDARFMATVVLPLKCPEMMPSSSSGTLQHDEHA